jgi:hypothetical protein
MALCWDPEPADADMIEYFRECLGRKGHALQIFVDPYSGLSLGVFNPTPGLKRQIIIGEARELHLPESEENSPAEEIAQSSQAYGSDIDEDDVARLQELVQTQPRQLVNEGDLIYKTSTRNKDRLKRLKVRRTSGRGVVMLKARQSRKKQPLSMSFVVESDEEGLQQGEVVVAVVEKGIDEWFATEIADHKLRIKQTDQRQLRRNAKEIAGAKVATEWQDFFRDWRDKGRLSSRPTSSSAAPTLAQRPAAVQELIDLFNVYDEVRIHAIADGFRAVGFRNRMVRLHHIYTQAEAVLLPGNEAPLRQGETRQAQKKRLLFNAYFPNFAGIKDVAKDPTSKTEWSRWSRSISWAKRWNTTSQELGYGVLGLIPKEVTNDWVGRLSGEHFQLWIRAIRHYNPGCEAVCRNWTAVLNRALAGLRPSRSLRTLEGMTERSINQHQVPQTLFCEDAGSSGDKNMPTGLESFDIPEVGGSDALVALFGGMEAYSKHEKYRRGDSLFPAAPDDI